MTQKRKNSPYYRSGEATKLDSALEQMFEAYKIKGKTDQTSIIATWEELMGKTIATRTTKLFFKGTCLRILHIIHNISTLNGNNKEPIKSHF